MQSKGPRKSQGPLMAKENQTTYKCTACSNEIKSSYEANLHPLIDCLLCRKCYMGYGSGDFALQFDDGVDEAGDDNYCRWCCDGGELYGCMNDCTANNERCHYSFCEECIKRNVPDDMILKLADMSPSEQSKVKWLCYACNNTPITKLRKDALDALEHLNTIDSMNRKRDRRSILLDNNGIQGSAAKRLKTNSKDSVEKPSESLREKQQSQEKQQCFSPSKAPTSNLLDKNNVTTPPSITSQSKRTPVVPVVQEFSNGNSHQRRLSATISTSINTSSNHLKHTSVIQPVVLETSKNSSQNKRTLVVQPPGLETSINIPQLKRTFGPPSSVTESSNNTSLNKRTSVVSPSTIPESSNNTSLNKRTSVVPPCISEIPSQISQYKRTSVASNIVNEKKLSGVAQTVIKKNSSAVKYCTLEDLKLRISVYNRTKDLSLEEINSKFNKLAEVVNSNEFLKTPKQKKILVNEISGLELAVEEFTCMVSDLKELVDSVDLAT